MNMYGPTGYKLTYFGLSGCERFEANGRETAIRTGKGCASVKTLVKKAIKKGEFSFSEKANLCLNNEEIKFNDMIEGQQAGMTLRVGKNDIRVCADVCDGILRIDIIRVG